MHPLTHNYDTILDSKTTPFVACGPLGLWEILTRNISVSRCYVFHLFASSFQICFTSQSPAQTVFSLQAKRTVINFHSYNVYLSGCLILESVPYFQHSIVSFLDPFDGAQAFD